MAWHEWPLMLFTVLAQTSVGSFLVLGGLLLSGQLSLNEENRLHKAMFFLWALMGLGFMASTAHLGSPLRAMNALNQVGSSWLSNEIFFGSLFFAAGGFYWLLSMLNKGTPQVRKMLLAAAMLIGIVFMYAMIKVYLIDTVPTWNNIFTPFGFILTMLLSGLLFAQLLLTGAQSKQAGHKLLPVAGAIAAVVSLVVTVLQMTDLSSINSAVTAAAGIIDNMQQLQLIRGALMLAALALWFKPLITSDKPTTLLLAPAFVLMFVSEFIARGIFYGLHMTTGM
ncbi:dimethyl sulfoxide reductase anchor subunit family protein [Psychromonas aquimarina]|uniref:dimethyl sulfoxide reductase anchor subunit family protein n=1 Tax=Psychromonas aquimarina TaxID=444919 RepID=UPI00040DFADA|nr:DmsC/YnfH family molybdoenzyme membrane anchor subunit [Psychromonas aquimarina]